MARFLTVSALISFHSGAFACSPGENFNAHFDGISKQLSAREAGRLAKWLGYLRKYKNHQSFMISGYVDRDGLTEDLANSRADWIKGFLIGAGEEGSRVIFVGAEPFRVGNGEYAGITPSTLIIDFLPGCPNGCCTADGEPALKWQAPTQ